MPHLVVNNLHKRFSNFTALHEISFAMEAGEMVSILGPSGCGKSTLLQLLAGLQKPDGGEIWLEGELLSDCHKIMPPELRPVNMVFQDYALWPHMDVWQNVTYGLKRLALPAAARKERAEELLTLLQLKGFQRRYPAQLSGGQQQRVAIARALASQPQLLLMDEPLSNLDIQLREAMRHELSFLLRELGTTVLYVTHDPIEAYAFADRLLILREGRVEQFGTPQEVHHAPASPWVAGLLGMTNRLHGYVLSRLSGDVSAEPYEVVRIGEGEIIGRVPEGLSKAGVSQSIVQGEVLVMVPAEAIRVEPVQSVETVAQGPEVCEQGHGLQAKVLHATFEGRNWRLLLEVAGQRLTTLSSCAFPLQSMVSLSFSKEETLVFPLSNT